MTNALATLHAAITETNSLRPYLDRVEAEIARPIAAAMAYRREREAAEAMRDQFVRKADNYLVEVARAARAFIDSGGEYRGYGELLAAVARLDGHQ